MTVSLLGPAEVRALAQQLGLRPTKTLGQNFVHDANTVRRIARLAQVGPGDLVAEVGPGLGSLTLALLATGASVVAVEIDPVLAAALPATVERFAPDDAERLRVITADAMTVDGAQLADGARPVDGAQLGDGAGPEGGPVSLVANLPYNVAVPVLLTALERVPSLRTALVMVQAEVADRLAARPGEAAYGVPSAKAAWWADVQRAGRVPPQVFWPVPKVDSGLVSLAKHDPPETKAARTEVFSCIDAAFAQRRKTLRAALAGWAGSPAAAEDALRAAGIDPSTRGERLSVAQFAAIAEHRPGETLHDHGHGRS